MKEQAEEELAKITLEEEELENFHCFKYLGVIQAGDGDPMVSVNHCVISPGPALETQKGTDRGETQSRLRIRLWNSSVKSNLFYGCENWKLTQAARRNLNLSAFNMQSRITKRTVADKARQPSLGFVIRARD